MRKIGIILMALVMVSIIMGCDEETATGPEGEDLGYYYSDSDVIVDDLSMSYTMAIPDDYDSDATPYPLVVALHYGGPPTPDYPKQFLSVIGLPGMIDLNPVILAPLTPVPGSWQNETSEKMIKAMLDDVVQLYNVDPSKTVIMGYSLGAMGTWYMTAKMPERFAVAVAVSGMPDDNIIPMLQDVPFYVIHSTVDEVFPYNDIEETVSQMIADGKDVYLHTVNGFSHYETSRFIEPLKEAIPWIKSKW